jgi:hypothetical protein
MSIRCSTDTVSPSCADRMPECKIVQPVLARQ